jgi:hypothetical protein
MQRIGGSMIVDSLVDKTSYNIALAHRINAEAANFSAHALLD